MSFLHVCQVAGIGTVSPLLVRKEKEGKINNFRKKLCFTSKIVYINKNSTELHNNMSLFYTQCSCKKLYLKGPYGVI